MLNAHPDADIFDDVFGAEATITPPGGDPVTMPAIPDARLGQSFEMQGDPFILNGPHFEIRADLWKAATGLDEVPINTTVLAARTPDAAPTTWTAVRVLDATHDSEYHLLVVLPVVTS